MNLRYKIFSGHIILMAVICSMVIVLVHERQRMREIGMETSKLRTVRRDINITHRRITGLAMQGEGVHIALNSTKKDRIAEITFQSTAKGIKEVLTITQAGQKSILKIVHSNEIWDIPIFRGSNVIGNVDWGDNSETDEYSEYLTHQYESSKERNVTVSVRNAESVKLENLIKVSSIDLSAF